MWISSLKEMVLWPIALKTAGRTRKGLFTDYIAHPTNQLQMKYPRCHMAGGDDLGKVSAYTKDSKKYIS